MTLRRLALITVVVAYILIVFGGYVSSSQSGMGCGPDWPLCNGVLVPDLQGETLVEYTHRIIGAILAILSIVLVSRILRSKTAPIVRTVAYWMIGILLVQVLFGAIVVILDVPASAVTVHMLLAMIFLTCLIWIWRMPKGSISPRIVIFPAIIDGSRRNLIINHLNVILVLLFITFGFGAYIKHEYYGMACSWASCGDTILPATFAQFLQTLHRLLAAITGIYILVLTAAAYAKGWERYARNRLVLASIAVAVQILVGVFTIKANIPISLAVIHLAAGTALYAIIAEARVSIGFNTK